VRDACAVMVFATLSVAGPAAAQDAFEIHVYEYEPLTRGQYSFEAHLNVDLEGTREFDGSVFPTHHQAHLTLEPTIGLSPHFALGFMFLNAATPGHGAQFAGWRVLPHLYAPESWHLPFRLGFVAEFSFQNTRYEENSRRVELRPILDREGARWQVVFNPVFERALRGPGTERGWNFEPALLLRWKLSSFEPSLEYYGEIESLTRRPRGQPQTHELFVGGDWRVRPKLMVNVGAGFDVGRRGPGLVLKSRLEWDIGRTRRTDPPGVAPRRTRTPTRRAAGAPS
jgi:hypothetical protein